MNNRTDEEVKAFLKELSALTLRYGIHISGCGCCGSPRLIDNDDALGDYEYNPSGYPELEWRPLAE